MREELVAWLQREAPYALPRTRVEVEQVEVTQDLGPEEVARAAEEIVAKQKAEADTAIKTVAGDDDTATEAAGETAAHGLGPGAPSRWGVPWAAPCCTAPGAGAWGPGEPGSRHVAGAPSDGSVFAA